MKVNPELRRALGKLMASAIIGIVFIVVSYLLFDVAFAAIAPDSTASKIALAFSHSAGVYGTLIGIVMACLLYTINEVGFKQKLLVFLKAFGGIILIIALFAFINENITKPIVKAERPSHIHMLKQLNAYANIDSIYGLSKEERIQWFSDQTTDKAVLFATIDAEVFKHWIAEGGYSFPSGHTFNAFLLAMIFAFGIGQNTKQVKLRNLYQMPFIWAAAVGLSRIALGVHTIYDVFSGACLGVTIGFVLLLLDQTRSIITHKKFE